jgi:pyruvate-formate lyase-activating enzyme
MGVPAADEDYLFCHDLQPVVLTDTLLRCRICQNLPHSDRTGRNSARWLYCKRVEVVI